MAIGEAGERKEVIAQLVVGAYIAAWFFVLFFGKNWWGWLDNPTPFGLAVRDVMILGFDGLALLGIVWMSASPLAGRNAWSGAVNMFFLAFMQVSVVTGRFQPHPRIVVVCGIVVAVAGVIGGLSILARRRWGAR
jgi:hypothetical protein